MKYIIVSTTENNGILEAEEQDNKPIHVCDALCRWLKTNELDGYLCIAEAEPHPQAKF